MGRTLVTAAIWVVCVGLMVLMVRLRVEPWKPINRYVDGVMVSCALVLWLTSCN